MEGDLRGGAVQMVGSEGTEAFEVPGAEWGGCALGEGIWTRSHRAECGQGVTTFGGM